MRDNLSLAFYVPGMPFDGDTPYKASLGGSETAGWAMARELAKLGHKVKIFTNLPERTGLFEEVHYLPANQWQAFATSTQHDISIVQRMPEAMMAHLESKFNLIWCHDLALGRSANQFRSVMWNIDKVLVVSDFMRKNYEDRYDLPAETIEVTRNGIYLEDFPAVTYRRNRKRLIYAARPERGLDVMFDKILPKLIERYGDIELNLYGYNNPVDQMQPFYQQISQKAAPFGDRVMFRGYLPKRELYAEYVQSGIYVYPSPSPKMPGFAEVSCISVMEAQAAGLPVVASARGALPETLGAGAGALISRDSMSEEYAAAFCDAVSNYLDNEDAYNAASRAGREHAKSLSWRNVALQWESMFERLFKEGNQDRTRLAYHFYRRTDIFAAKKALEGEDNELANRLRDKITAEYAFTESPEAFKEHYLAGGRETTERLNKYDISVHNLETTEEFRFLVIEQELAKLPEGTRILDYGCGHGWSSVYLHNKSGHAFTGVDIDAGAVDFARRIADAHANNPNLLTFIEGDINDVQEGDELPWGAPFDALICSEVLEHCVDPVATIAKLERLVKPGGRIFLTVPYGPSEYGTHNWEHFRNHLWEFDSHDLYDIFDAKKELNITATRIYPNDKIGEMIGFYFLRYNADGKPYGQINWDRKLRLQRPRQTLSAILMAGKECEDTLRWCLKSLRWVADEIVIADTGMSDEVRRLALEAHARIVPSVDPTEYGFEAPRNDGLDAAKTDWVLWIDTDERLVDPVSITKYLRQSMWTGMAIRQHHFAVDTGFQPDMPVRLFRKDEWKGKRMRFYGYIHEHPEFELNEGPGPVLIIADVNIAHIGYLAESGRRVKFVRNRPLLLKDMEVYPDRLLQKHFIMRDNMLLNMYQAQQNGNQIDDEMRARARENVELYRKHFLGKVKYTHVDTLQYYTEALRTLGEGVDVGYTISVARDGQGDHINGVGTVARFTTVEEAVAELSQVLKNKMEPLQTGEW